MKVPKEYSRLCEDIIPSVEQTDEEYLEQYSGGVSTLIVKGFSKVFRILFKVFTKIRKGIVTFFKAVGKAFEAIGRHKKKIAVFALVIVLSCTAIFAMNQFGLGNLFGGNVSIAPPQTGDVPGGILQPTENNYNGFEYIYNPNLNGYEIVGCTEPFSEVVIPEMIYDCNVVSIGYGAFRDCNFITSVVIPDSVVEIGEEAFTRCDSLDEVTIGRGVLQIGAWAFESCENLNEVYIYDLYAWVNIYFENSCSQPLHYGAKLYVDYDLVTNLVVPEGVGAVNQYAFYGCLSILSVTIPSSVNVIEEGAFGACYRIVEVVNDSSLYIDGSYDNGELGTHAINIYNAYDNFEGTQIYYYDDYLIYGGDLLIGYEGYDTNLILPSHIGAIHNYAFYGESEIEIVVIGESVYYIGNYAFADCDSLQAVEILNGTCNSWGVFEGCDSLQYVFLGEGVYDISCSSVFVNCESILEINVSYDNPYYMSMDGNLYSSDGSTLLKYASGKTDSSFEIPYGVSSIGEGAFSYSAFLQDVSLPNSVKSIEYRAFSNCYALENVGICAGVEYIGYEAFGADENLTVISFWGNSDEWYSINKDEYWHNCSSIERISCYDGNIWMY